jgi:nucleoside-diphosphate-sugar epimerase
MSPPLRLFVFGLGYSAARIAHAAKGEADWIGGTVRSIDEALRLAAAGIRSFMFDGSGPGIGVAEAVRHSTALIVSVPPVGASDPVLAAHRANVVAAEHLAWIGYLSTVGVYGDANGGWVDEWTPAKPSNARSHARLAAEQAWEAVARERGVPLAIFRIAGIYGPGRNAFVNLAEGTAHRTVKSGQVFNRIHVDDIVTTVAAARHLRASGIFNVADDEPAPPQDVVAHAADLMGVDPPPEVPFEEASLSPMAQSFYAESKRVKNGRIKSELGVRLAFPTYREGLAGMWREGTWRG